MNLHNGDMAWITCVYVLLLGCTSVTIVRNIQRLHWSLLLLHPVVTINSDHVLVRHQCIFTSGQDLIWTGVCRALLLTALSRNIHDHTEIHL